MKIHPGAVLMLIYAVYSGFSCPSLYADSRILNHNIEIELDVFGSSLRAADVLTIDGAGRETFQCFLNGNLKVRSVKIAGKDVRFNRHGLQSGGMEIFIPTEARQDKKIDIEVSYQGKVCEEITPESLKSPDPTKTTGIITEAGVYLSHATQWYPDQPESLATYTVKTLTPTGYEVVMPGRLVERGAIDDKLSTTWQSSHPSDSCTLVAGRYKVTSVEHNGIKIYTFFFPEEQGLAPTYLKAARRYLDMYEEMFGDYPYSKFAVVENFFPSGYGMPSYTLLGRTVVKLPFIVETSLGHEIAHNWWGNSVFCDDKKGNWCEGLTTYCADYHYKELKGPRAAEEYRRGACRKYTSYVSEENDFPLRRFLGRVDQASRAIGYGKAMMVFHMVRKMIGDKPFYDALRLVYKRNIWKFTTWEDFQLAFEEVSGRDLGWYFRQWIDRKGAPKISLGRVESHPVENGYRVQAELLQEGRAFHLLVPMALKTRDGEQRQTVESNSARTEISFTTASQPVALSVDPGNDLFRRLHSEETPATLDSVLGDRGLIVAYAADMDTTLREAYDDITGYLVPDKRAAVMAGGDITESDIADNSLLIMGMPEDNAVFRKLMANLPEEVRLKAHAFVLNGKEYADSGASLLACFKNPLNKGKSVCLFIGLGAEGVRLAGAKLVHYGKYSYLAFINGKNVDKGVWDVKESPLSYRFQ